MYKEYQIQSNSIFKCLWYSETSLAHQPIMADACADLIFKIEQNKSSYFLITSQISTIYAQTDDLSYYYGLRFNPGGFHFLTSIPLKEITNQFIDATVFPFTHSLKLYFHYWYSHNNFIPLYQKIIELIHINIKKHYLSQLLNQNWDKKTIESIAHDAGYSLRHFRRIINEQIGCSPYFYYLLMRMNKAIGLKKTNNIPDAEIAAICHYSDQAHMLNDIKKLSNISFSSWV